MRIGFPDLKTLIGIRTSYGIVIGIGIPDDESKICLYFDSRQYFETISHGVGDPSKGHMAFIERPLSWGYYSVAFQVTINNNTHCYYGAVHSLEE